MTPRDHARKMLVKRNHAEDRSEETVTKVAVSEPEKKAEAVETKKTTAKKTATKKAVAKTEEPSNDNVG